MKKLLGIGGLVALALFVTNCGGGGGGGTTSTGTTTPGSDALEVAEKVSVVDAKSTASTNLSAPKALKVNFKAVAALPAGSAYNTDQTFTFVNERSAESFIRINEILCSMAQTNYAEMLNQGPYKAMIDTTQCDQNMDSAEGAGASSQNQSSGSNATQYELWTVNSSRETDQPHYVQVWMHEEGEDMGDFSEPAKDILVNIEITEAVSAANPIGIFTADFKGCPQGDTACATPFMQGYLKSEYDSNDDVLLKFYVSGGMGDFTFTEQATLNKDPDGDAGSGSVRVSDYNKYEGAFSSSFNLAYDGDYFYRADRDGSNGVCLDRNNYVTNVWRYGLYYDENHASAGGRVARSSGFPIKYTSGENTYHGFAGYYGVWLPGSASIESGTTVYRQNYSSSDAAETPYTVFVARGRLNKHIRQTTTLGDIKNIPLSYSQCSEGGCNEFRVKWNGTSLVKDGTRSQASNWMWQAQTESVLTFSDNDYDFNFWSEALGGSGRVILRNNEGQLITPNSSTVVIFHKVTTVYPGDAGIPTTLACFENCIDPSLLGEQDYYFTNSTWEGGENQFNMVNQQVAPDSLVAVTNYISYTFDATTMELEYGGTPMVLEDNSANEFGVWGGALVETGSFTDLACPWNPNGTCTWNVWDLDEFYTWETGADEWNKLTALKDASEQYVTFDPPLMVRYTSSGGTKYFLEYNGYGDLWGIPGKCVDEDSGSEVECGDAGGDMHIRWVPEFSIAAGSAVTDVINSTTYYVKPLDQEQMMVATDSTSTCTGAGLSLTSYDLPGASLVTDPGIGDEPAVSGAPAVIGGVLQE